MYIKGRAAMELQKIDGVNCRQVVETPWKVVTGRPELGDDVFRSSSCHSPFLVCIDAEQNTVA